MVTRAYMQRLIYKIALINSNIYELRDKIQSENRFVLKMQKELQESALTGLCNKIRTDSLIKACDCAKLVLQSYKDQIQKLISEQSNLVQKIKELQTNPNFPLAMAKSFTLYDNSKIID
jgi:cell division protein FtsB